MGYMGFGMKREVYTRKPRKVFSNLKRINGEDIDHHFHRKHIELQQGRKFSEKEWVTFREKLKIRAKKEKRKQIIVLAVSLVLAILILMVLAWGVKELLS